MSFSPWIDGTNTARRYSNYSVAEVCVQERHPSSQEPTTGNYPYKLTSFWTNTRKYHETRVVTSSDEYHKTEGGLLKPMIFGGLDGILTSFAIVAGAAGGNLSSGVVLILGFSNIFADALSMGVGEFLSSKAENEWILSERRREEWELENYPEGEIREMVDLYMEKGMSRQDAESVITTMAKYKDFFVDIMMTQELQLQVPEDDHVAESFREGTSYVNFSFGKLSIEP